MAVGLEIKSVCHSLFAEVVDENISTLDSMNSCSYFLIIFFFS